MSRIPGTIYLTSYAVLFGMVVVQSAAAQESGSGAAVRPGPLTSLSAEEQTRLALSTAPQEVSSRASVYVLTAKGYTQVHKGTNGFSCLVERELLETIEPACYDAEGSATTMLARFYREELRGQGLREDEVKRRIVAAYRDGRLLAPRKPGLLYMLAPEQWSLNPFTGKVWQPPPHYMIYAPYARQEDLGGSAGANMPVLAWPGQPDALIIIMAQNSRSH